MERFKYFILLHIVFAVYSFVGIASKIASSKPFLSAGFLFFYGIVIATLFVYAIVWQQLLKKLPLVTAYANKAVTVIWGIVWGYFFFNEGITIYKLIGAVVIVIGVYLVVSSDGESNVLDNILEEEK